MSWVVGIDPGLNGAIAFLNHDARELKVFDMPVLAAGSTGKRMVDAQGVVRIFEGFPNIRHIFIEQVGARPGQGVVSMFNFGVSCGVIAGVVASTKNPYTMVTPLKWKKAMAVPAEKESAKLRANQLLPKFAEMWPMKKHDGRAEAALLALYGLGTYDKSVIKGETQNAGLAELLS